MLYCISLSQNGNFRIPGTQKMKYLKLKSLRPLCFLQFFWKSNGEYGIIVVLSLLGIQMEWLSVVSKTPKRVLHIHEFCFTVPESLISYIFLETKRRLQNYNIFRDFKWNGCHQFQTPERGSSHKLCSEFCSSYFLSFV